MNQPNSDIFFPAKPDCSYGEVVATDRGWEVEQSSGFREILISYPNMKTLMDAEEAKRNPAPVVEDTPPSPPPVVPPAPAFTEEELAAQAAAKAAAEAAAASQGGSEGGEGASSGEGATGGNEGGEGASNGTPAPAPATAGTVLFTSEGLNALKMDDLRVIGDKFEVKDTSKAALIKKILEAQEAKQAAAASA